MSDIIFYETPEGKVHIQVRFENETFWLTQKAMAALFGTSTQNITLHLKNVFDENELQLESTCKDFLQVQTEGNRQVERSQKFYNLDAVIAVGYRVNSKQATQFRIWVTQRMKVETKEIEDWYKTIAILKFKYDRLISLNSFQTKLTCIKNYNSTLN